MPTINLNSAPAIVCDTREGEYVYQFDHPTVIAKLDTGDYSLQGFENIVAVERKELGDFIGCITSSRERFEKELKRSMLLARFWVVIEATVRQVLISDFFSKVHPNAVIGSWVAWENRYNAHFVFAGDRDTAQRMTELILKRAWLDDFEGKSRLVKPFERWWEE